ncbi:MAG: hypothetical protein JNL67_02465 [Planctomycetaceae bacterium]|nr:hypothetical protein [Planctomycetaceae bacterium]
MPKLLCIIALVISLLVFVLFLLDLIMGVSGNAGLAPFKYSDPIVDVVFAVGSGVLGFLSFTTLREQV